MKIALMAPPDFGAFYVPNTNFNQAYVDVDVSDCGDTVQIIGSAVYNTGETMTETIFMWVVVIFLVIVIFEIAAIKKSLQITHIALSRIADNIAKLRRDND